ncbi:MAG TPA: aspartate--tRNA(Asn) ligase, partial [Candidatus Nanoarchaeia archaeon]|nr:aspartate--tRNA(Asn) ligase [Candidatus Nanoarchaeia archaeon]
MRTLSSQVLDHAGKSVVLRGWLHKKRAMGALMFVVLRDRGGLIQIVVKDEAEQEKLRGMQVGTVLEVTGKVKAEPRATGGAEIHEPSLAVLVPVEAEPPIEIDKPIDHTPDNLDTLFEHRVVNLRNLDEQRIFRVREALIGSIRNFLSQNEFVEIQTPKLIAGATEGGAEVFKLKYFDQEATLAQSPQFYKQIMVGAFERVFEIGPAFRAEPSLTTRHLAETTMLDIEMGFIDGHEDVLKMTEQLVYSVLTSVYKDSKDDLEKLKAPELKLKKEFPRYTVAQVHEMFTKGTGQDTTKEKDLIPAEERWICDYSVKEHGCEAVFVSEFPVEAMKFYHMVNPDNPKTV